MDGGLCFLLALFSFVVENASQPQVLLHSGPSYQWSYLIAVVHGLCRLGLISMCGLFICKIFLIKF